MSDISASELDLLTFFEVEPTLLDKAESWIYNDALYEIRKGEVDLSFAVSPCNKDVRIMLKCGGTVMYELNSMALEDVKYHNDDGNEFLEIVILSTDKLLLKLKPAISLSHIVDSKTP